MSAERAFVDTNVLVDALFSDAPHHEAALHLLSCAQAGEVELYVIPQMIGELLATITNARRVTSPFSPHEAVAAVRSYLATSGITLLPLPPDVVDYWLALIERRPVKGGDVFDLQIIAAMLSLDITAIYTFNVGDFNWCSDIVVKAPHVV